jgi:hypothetical protein
MACAESFFTIIFSRKNPALARLVLRASIRSRFGRCQGITATHEQFPQL